jgi:DNA-binding NtrC family response regulator
MTHQPEQISSNQRTVLLVEDDTNIRKALEFFLESLEINYFSVGDGQEAIDLLSSKTVDVLMTDFDMPKVDGVELLRWCRAHDRHFPVIFMSATADLLEKEEIALKDCCACLLSKPVNLDDLERVVEAAFARKHHELCVHQRGG